MISAKDSRTSRTFLKATCYYRILDKRFQCLLPWEPMMMVNSVYDRTATILVFHIDTHRGYKCDHYVWTVIVYGLAINDPKDYNCFYIEAKIVLRTIFEGKKFAKAERYLYFRLSYQVSSVLSSFVVRIGTLDSFQRINQRRKIWFPLQNASIFTSLWLNRDFEGNTVPDNQLIRFKCPELWLDASGASWFCYFPQKSTHLCECATIVCLFTRHRNAWAGLGTQYKCAPVSYLRNARINPSFEALLNWGTDITDSRTVEATA